MWGSLIGAVVGGAVVSAVQSVLSRRCRRCARAEPGEPYERLDVRGAVPRGGGVAYPDGNRVAYRA